VKWREEQQGSKVLRTEAPSKGGRVFAALAIILAIIATIVALILWARPVHEPEFHTISVTEYTNKLIPVNGWAQQDSNTLKARFDRSTKAYASQELDAFRRELKSLKTKVVADDGLILHMSALALDVNGEVYLLAADADPEGGEPGTLGMALSEVLTLVRDIKVGRKLLVLDIMRPTADPRLGVLFNDVAERTQTAVEAALETDPALLVLLPCMPGQLALTSEDMGMSVLGFYLDEGLRGHADRYNENHKSIGRVSVRELAAFVRARVDRWARDNRQTRQTPVLLGKKDRDFELLAADKSAEPPEAAALEKYLDGLMKGWQLRDAWLEDDVQRFAPRALRKLEAELLRAEERWMGGAATADAIEEQLKTEINAVQKQVKQAREPLVLPTAPRSLSLLAERERKPVPPGLVEVWKNLFNGLESLKKPEPEALAKLRTEFLEKNKVPFTDTVRTALAVAAEDSDLKPIKLLFLEELIESEQAGPARYVETLFLRRLSEPGVLGFRKEFEPNRGRLAMETVRQALRLLNVAERPAGFDARVFPWVKPALEAAAEERLQCEEKIFDGRVFSSTSQTETLGTRLKTLEDTYRRINTSCENIQEAYRVNDRALLLLPGFVPYLNRRPPADRAEENQWNEAVSAACELHELLRWPGANNPAGEAELRSRIDELQLKTAVLKRLLGDKGSMFRHLAPDYIKRLDDIEEMDALLACSWLKAKERELLWSRRRELARDRHRQTRENDDADNQTERKVTKELEAFDTKAAIDLERQRGDRRARLAVGLLKLGGQPGFERLDKERVAAARQENVEALAPLGARIQQAWTKDVPSQLDRLARKAGDLMDADRLSRVVHPFEPGAPINFAGRLLEGKTREFRTWLGQRCRRQGQAAGASAPWRDFYDQWADDYLRYSQ
jgi:hypothetical protein